MVGRMGFLCLFFLAFLCSTRISAPRLDCGLIAKRQHPWLLPLMPFVSLVIVKTQKTLLWVELCPPRWYVYVLTPDTCDSNLCRDRVFKM